MSIKKILLLAIGAVLVVGGITLVLRDWVYIKMVFRGVIGPLLAVVGMVVLTAARE